MAITLWIKLKRRKSTKMTETRPNFLFHRITTPPPPTTTSTCYDNEPIFWLILFVSRLTQSSKILYSWSMVRCIKPFVFSLSFVPIHFLFLAFVFDLHVCLCASLFSIFIQKKITVGWQATLVFFLSSVPHLIWICIFFILNPVNFVSVQFFWYFSFDLMNLWINFIENDWRNEYDLLCNFTCERRVHILEW